MKKINRGLLTLLVICLPLPFLATITHAGGNSLEQLQSNGEGDALRIQAIIVDESDQVGGGLPLEIHFTPVDARDLALSNETGKISIDGHDVVEATLHRANNPFYVALVIDGAANQQDVQTAFEHLLAAATEKAHLSITLFREDSTLIQDFTADQYLLQDAMRELSTVGGWQPSCPLDAINDAAESLLEMPAQAQRAVIVFTSGRLINTNSPCRNSTAEDLNNIAAFAKRNQVALHLVQPGSGQVSIEEQALADSTGGLATAGLDTLEQHFVRIMDGLSNQWIARATATVDYIGEHEARLQITLPQGEQMTTLWSNVSPFTTTRPVAPPVTAPAIGSDIKHDIANQILRVPVYIPQMMNENCLVIIVRDLATNAEVSKSEQLCPSEEEERIINLSAPQVEEAREYCIELHGYEELPSPECGSERSTLAVRFGTLDSLAADLRVEPDSENRRILLYLTQLQVDGTIAYEVLIEKDNAVLLSRLGALRNAQEPIIVDYYPTEEEDDARYTFVVTFSAGGREGAASREDVLLPVPRRGFWAILGQIWREMPVSNRLFLSIMTGAPLLLLFAAIMWIRGQRRQDLIKVPLQKDGAQPLIVSAPYREGVVSLAPPPIEPETLLPEPMYADSDLLPAPAGPTDVDAPPQAFLKILAAPDQLRVNQTIKIERLPWFIGRGHCELSIGDGNTSREHAVINYEDGVYFIEDCESKNGTFIDDSDVSLSPGMRWPLNRRSRIQLGSSVTLDFCLQTEAER